MLGTCDGSDMVSIRDKMMLMVLYNTGCRTSELINIQIRDITLNMDGTSSIRFMGKGRKERITPIWKTTASFIKKKLEETSDDVFNYKPSKSILAFLDTL